MSGHRPSYLRRIVSILLAHNYRVIVAMPTPCFEHQVAKGLFGKHKHNRLSGIRCDVMTQISEPTNPLLMLFNEYRCVRFYRTALKEAQRQTQIDLIFIGMLDDAAILAGITGLRFGGIPWLGIVMRQNFHFSQMGALAPLPSRIGLIKKRLFLRLLRRADKNSLILTIDKLLLDFVNSKYPEISASIAHIPDAVDNRVPVVNPEIRQELGIPNDAFVIMAYGALRENKGVKLLVTAMRELPEQIHVMLVGNQDSEIKCYLETEQCQYLFASGRLHQVNRYIDVSEDANFFTAADLIWIGYKDYYAMSAVLVQAAQYRRPVIATNTGLVGWLTEKHQTGAVINTANQHEIVEAINKAASDTSALTSVKYDLLVEDHSLTTFENALLPCFKKLIA